MQRLWTWLGIALFWLGWPVFWVFLPWSERTRVLLVHDNKVLVVRGWIGNGRWGLPGGGVHRGEDHLRGVLRELAEETGICLPAFRLKFLLHNTYRDMGFRFPCYYYVAELDEPTPVRRQRAELSSLEWVEYSKLNRGNANADILEALQAYATWDQIGK